MVHSTFQFLWRNVDGVSLRPTTKHAIRNCYIFLVGKTRSYQCDYAKFLEKSKYPGGGEGVIEILRKGHFDGFSKFNLNREA